MHAAPIRSRSLVFSRGLPMMLALLLASPALRAQTPTTPANGPLVTLSAQASRSASNDMFQATVFAEASQASSAAVAQQVNQQIEAALSVAQTYPNVRAKTGNTRTYPVYGKNDRSIEAWRMHSEILLESRDSAALGELLGKLQADLGVSQLNASPAPETARKAESDATIAAIQAFRERAALIAGALGKKYKIREMEVGNTNAAPVYPMFRAKTMTAASPMPVEGGDSQVVVNINGKIELID